MSSVVGPVPAANAAGAAACVISGTISFVPPSDASGQGAWSIGPAMINCQGIFSGYHFIGPGPFTGSGSYTATLPSSGGSCVDQVGTGTVDYTLQTEAMDYHKVEAKRFVLAGAGEFTTPSLRGSLQLMPPYEGDCVTKPVTRATFFAEGVMARANPFFVGDPAAR
jgi:hypothetical protein